MFTKSVSVFAGKPVTLAANYNPDDIPKIPCWSGLTMMKATGETVGRGDSLLGGCWDVRVTSRLQSP